MKYEEIVTSLQTEYLIATAQAKEGIIRILKENGGIIDIGDGDYETPVITMWDGNGVNEDITVKSIKLSGGNTIYVNGISDYNDDVVSYEAFSEHYYWLLDFIHIWDENYN